MLASLDIFSSSFAIINFCIGCAGRGRRGGVGVLDGNANKDLRGRGSKVANQLILVTERRHVCLTEILCQIMMITMALFVRSCRG